MDLCNKESEKNIYIAGLLFGFKQKNGSYSFYYITDQLKCDMILL